MMVCFVRPDHLLNHMPVADPGWGGGGGGGGSGGIFGV